jgi:hypothetical protein
MKKNHSFWEMLILALLTCLTITGCSTTGKGSNQNDFDTGGELNFHIIDEVETENFYNYIKDNPDITINNSEQLKKLDEKLYKLNIVRHSDLSRVFDINVQRRNKKAPQYYEPVYPSH